MSESPLKHARKFTLKKIWGVMGVLTKNKDKLTSAEARLQQEAAVQAQMHDAMRTELEEVTVCSTSSRSFLPHRVMPRFIVKVDVYLGFCCISL